VVYVQNKENDKRSTRTEPGINERRRGVVGGEGVTAVMCIIRRRFEGRGWRRRRRSGCLSEVGARQSQDSEATPWSVQCCMRVRDLDVGLSGAKLQDMLKEYLKDRERECAFMITMSRSVRKQTSKQLTVQVTNSCQR
jgi:hypothetical protein